MAIRTLVVFRSRELAYQIKHELERFATYFSCVSSRVANGGKPIVKYREMLQKTQPQVTIGTPGHVLTLPREMDIKLDRLT